MRPKQSGKCAKGDCALLRRYQIRHEQAAVCGLRQGLGCVCGQGMRQQQNRRNLSVQGRQRLDHLQRISQLQSDAGFRLNIRGKPCRLQIDSFQLARLAAQNNGLALLRRNQLRQCRHALGRYRS
jgi:hypothetical protein